MLYLYTKNNISQKLDIKLNKSFVGIYILKTDRGIFLFKIVNLVVVRNSDTVFGRKSNLLCYMFN